MQRRRAAHESRLEAGLVATRIDALPVQLTEEGVPPERRGDRRPEAFDPVDVLGEPENAGEYLLQYAALGGVATVLAGGSLYFLLAQ